MEKAHILLLFRKEGDNMMLLKRKKKGQRVWIPLVTAKIEEEYRRKCKILDEEGIDYRVWMKSDHPDLVYLREYTEDEERYRLYYVFYVKIKDFWKASRILEVFRNHMFWGMHIAVL